MIDKISGFKVMVSIDEVYGPYFEIYGGREPLWLEKILQGRFYLPYWVVKKTVPDKPDVLIYYFGAAADPIKLQKIVDEIQSGVVES